ncbi:MAG TPA: MFS transporter [Solirubrobacteraceae bacterium]|jgi:MFS family permease|nr:MFS transporter [Solirubrobacteraceae bacterium]
MSAAGTSEHTGSELTTGTIVAACLAACVGQIGFATPAVLNGLFQQDLGTTASQLNWISAAIVIPLTLFELTFGVIGDMFGRKRLLVGGALLMTIGELIAAVVTPSASTHNAVVVVWIGMALAGIGGAALFPTSLAMIAAKTTTAKARGRMIPIYAAALSSGGFLAPVLAGLLTKLAWGGDPGASWRWALVAVMATALLSAIVSFFAADDSRSPEGRTLDWPGQITFAIGLFALLFAVVQASSFGWTGTQSVIGYIVCVVSMAVFVRIELRTREPLLRLKLFASRDFSLNSFVTVIGMFAFLGCAAATSIRLTAVQGFSPLRASLGFVALQGFALFLLPLISWMMPRVNPRWMLGGGFLLQAVGAAWAATVSINHDSVAAILPPLAVVGIGFGFSVSSVTAVAVNTVRIQLAGMASATTSLLRDFGFALGPTVVIAIGTSRAAGKISHAVARSPALQHRVATFYHSVATAPADAKAATAAAVGAVKSGPLGAVAVPATTQVNGHTVPLNPLHDAAYHALGSSYQLVFAICAACALVAAALVLAVLRADAHHDADELALAESRQVTGDATVEPA